MTPAARRAQLRAILDRHNDIARALDRSTQMHDAAQQSLETTGQQLRDATHAIREAARAMIAANEAAFALWNEDDGEAQA